MRIAVVGNGPSANGLGKEIDRCDMVVRAGQFKQAFPKDQAGKKLSAWAWPGYPKNNNLVPKGKGYCIWVTCPWGWHKGPVRRKNVLAVANRQGLHISAMPLPQYLYVRKYLNRLAKDGKDLAPTTGILAVHMAVATRPKEILLAGHDAIKPGTPGWRYADGRKLSAGPHRMGLEKELLKELFEGSWLGNDSDILVDWRQL